MRLTSRSVEWCSGQLKVQNPCLILFPTLCEIASSISSSALRGVTQVNGASGHVTR